MSNISTPIDCMHKHGSHHHTMIASWESILNFYQLQAQGTNDTWKLYPRTTTTIYSGPCQFRIFNMPHSCPKGILTRLISKFNCNILFWAVYCNHYTWPKQLPILVQNQVHYSEPTAGHCQRAGYAQSSPSRIGIANFIEWSRKIKF